MREKLDTIKQKFQQIFKAFFSRKNIFASKAYIYNQTAN